MATPISKLLAVALLGAVVLFLGMVVVTMQLYVLQRKRLISPTHGGSRKDSSSSRKIHSETVDPSTPITEKDVYLWKQYSPMSNSPATAAKAYWNQAVPALQEWDATLQNDDNASPSQQRTNHSHALYSLLKASKLGNAEAQYYVANALASGIWPVDDSTADDEKKYSLHVPQDVHALDNQTTLAHLLWRMSAMDGHVDSAIALGYRILSQEGGVGGNDAPATNSACKAALPYYEAAAHGVMDELEANVQYRGKVSPPMDKHVLAQVHMHGGTSSQLQYHNKPDESLEALQYYHLRATMSPEPDLNAAYTLGHLYHYGLRGVTQNMTLALKYYEIAADRNHWEAGGQAGKFHFWALGMDPSERDLAKAHKYFRKGAPVGLNGCMERFKNSRKKDHVGDEDENAPCDHPSLNGMGLVHLFGIPHLIPRDFEKARKYFKLSKQMGNMDAAYNLAMMKLGWKENYVDDDDIPVKEDGGQTVVDPLVPSSYKKPYKGPNKSTIVDAVNDLATAALKGQVQARHRLGMMYARGVVLENVDGKDVTVVSKDCNKALTHYKHVVDNASTSLSKRTRKAYKQYIRHDYEAALRNYLAAAETGSEVGQVNAAFLLEQGTCLNLSEQDCAKASVRLYKAAAKQGNAEACLRVGDFYFYGRLRQVDRDPVSPVGPFLWLQYLIYPEKLIPIIQNAIDAWTGKGKVKDSASSSDAPVCTADDGETCPAVKQEHVKQQKQHEKSSVESDLSMAARYYRMAADQHKSPRANFNLGFMHEWGLGLTQDFPLAKRHYDLASPASSNMREAEVAVQIAVWFLNLHETFVKFRVAWNEWRQLDEEAQVAVNVPKMSDNDSVGHPVPTDDNKKKQQQNKHEGVGATSITDVIISHMLSWETLLIVVLTIVLSKLVQHRRTRPTR